MTPQQLLDEATAIQTSVNQLVTDLTAFVASSVPVPTPTDPSITTVTVAFTDGSTQTVPSTTS